MDQATQGAAIIGALNVLSILFPDLNSKHKVVLVVIIGAVLAYLPLAHPVVKGIEFALATSGVYKLAQVVKGS